MLLSPARKKRWRYAAYHKFSQLKRFFKKSIPLILLTVGATLVALSSLFFAHLADYALLKNVEWVQDKWWYAWLVLPLGLVVIVWLTRTFAPYTSGSGIPQVIAGMELPLKQRLRLVGFKQTLLKIPLTFLGMFVGASTGREGPSVQVGAAVMLAWGRFCRKHGWFVRTWHGHYLLAAGAAGGLAAAFNAPLAGVIFAIEELGRGLKLRWQRQIFICILIAGFVRVALEGNNPYFKHFQGDEITHMVWWVIVFGILCGITSGLFARALFKGPTWLLPSHFRGWIRKHPLWLAAILGLLLAALGSLSQGTSYGTGYQFASAGLQGESGLLGASVAKWLATVFSYWSNIPGGIFTPCLTIGAMMGQDLAQLFNMYDATNIIVLLCMAAFLSGATQAPLTSSVVVMEMTDSQSLLFWMLIACIIAAQISKQFNPRPFYHAAGERFRRLIQQQAHEAQKHSQGPTPPAQKPS
ncbi:chloride channel protein [Brackiella oedipodis]|uniref:chloride channel protein n=1 Tax=Brackiella oedipodis TaxID=124225 RepID=UPI0009FF5032|nr:chloride channel protein [Brackiella oedipodis]